MRFVFFAWLTFIAVVLWLAVGLWPAHSHSWYPAFCCNEGDCHPVPCEDIQEGPTDTVWNGFHFRKDRTFPSQDSKCHACVGHTTFSGDVPYCIFTQQGS
jgi:hypothetical protein